MTIDVDGEKMVRFADAAREFPGKAVCLQTLHRYRRNGVRGVKLETCLIGGLRYTSKEAIQRFIEAQNSVGPAPTVTPSQRAKQSAAARAELAKMGI